MAGDSPAGDTDTSPKAAAARPAARRRVFSFPKEARIANRARFLELYAAPGRKLAGKFFVLFSGPAPEGAERHRLGVTAAKRTFHDSHERNRAKRLLRESFRLACGSIGGQPRDFVLVARRPILGAKCGQVRAEFERLAKKAVKNGAPQGGQSAASDAAMDATHGAATVS